MNKDKRIWVIEDKYYYIPHHKYPDVFELYYVDKEAIDHCVQNFTLEEHALAMTEEDAAWRGLNVKISHKNAVTYDVENDLVDKRKTRRISKRGESRLTDEQKKQKQKEYMRAYNLKKKAQKEASNA